MGGFLSGLLGTLGGIVNPIESLLGLPLGIIGAIQGGKQNAWMQQMGQNISNEGLQAAANQQDWRNALQNMVSNPGQFMSNAMRMAPTLNANLTQGINNAVSSNLAQQGLGGSPGQMTAMETSALAPYAQQNQLAAIQSYLSLLGMPGPLNSSVMQFGTSGRNFLPQAPSGAGGFGLSPLPTNPQNPQNPSFPLNMPSPLPNANQGPFNPGLGIPNIPSGTSPIDLSGIGGQPSFTGMF